MKRALPNQATILIAEDSDDDMQLMLRAFEKARLANPVQVVTDGVRAVEYLEGEGVYGDRQKYPFPILLLLDLKMPRRGGFEVLEWIRRQPKLKRLPVVVLTASAETPDINRAYDLGANSYLVKPSQFEDLIALIHKLEGYWVFLNQKPDAIPRQQDETGR